MNPNYSLKVFKKPSYIGVLSLVFLLLSWWSIVPAHWVHHGVSIHSHSSKHENHNHHSKTETTSANLPDQHPATDLDQTCFALGIWNANPFFELSQNYILWRQGFPNQLLKKMELHLIPIYLLGQYLKRGPPHFPLA